jgi:trans-aconitate 2-methyltransferase
MTHVTPSWDPHQYLRHADHRTRPFADLIAHIGDLPSGEPGIVDLGCGAGNATALLAERWPKAQIRGLDNSQQMLDAARTFATSNGYSQLKFAHADAGTWEPSTPLDLLVSNALLQWVPGHTDRFEAWIGGLKAGGSFAFQVPGNFDAPSHALMRELAARPRWRNRLHGVLRASPVLTPGAYLEILEGLGCAVDAWETTYVHVLTGEDPVLDWVSGTGLRPVLDALDSAPEEREEFLAVYRALLREAYPATSVGTIFPFRRIFVVATRR